MRRDGRGSGQRRTQIIFWILSALVVLSMVLGLIASILPRSSPAEGEPSARRQLPKIAFLDQLHST